MTLIAILVPILAVGSAVLVGVLGYLIDKNTEAAEHK
jgi:hypothetical protein